MAVQVKSSDPCSQSVLQLWSVSVNGGFKHASHVITQVERPDIRSILQYCFQHPGRMAVSFSAAVDIQEPEIYAVEASNRNQAAFI